MEPIQDDPARCPTCRGRWVGDPQGTGEPCADPFHANNPNVEPIQDDRPRRIKCPHCGGHGLVGVWVGDYEVAECEECGGMGELTVYPNDSVAMYPGGPMRGSWPGAYEKAL